MSLRGIRNPFRGRSKSEGRETDRSDFLRPDPPIVARPSSKGGGFRPIGVDQGGPYVPSAPPSHIDSSSTDEESDIPEDFWNKNVKGKHLKKMVLNIFQDIATPRFQAVDTQLSSLKHASNRFSRSSVRTGDIEPPDTAPDSSIVGGLDRSAKLGRVFQNVPIFKQKDGNVREFLQSLRAKVLAQSYLKITDSELKSIILDKLSPEVCRVIDAYEPSLNVKDIFKRLTTHFDDSESPGEAQQKLCALKPNLECSTFAQFRAEAGRLAAICQPCDPQLYIMGLLNFLPPVIVKDLKDNVLHYQSIHGKGAHPSIEELLEFLAPYRREIDSFLEGILKDKKSKVFRSIQAPEEEDGRKGRNVTCSKCRRPGHSQDTCWKDALCNICGRKGHVGQVCRAPRCKLCGNRNHNTENCSLYPDVKVVKDPCPHCVTLHGSALFHDKSKCLMRELVSGLQKN